MVDQERNLYDFRFKAICEPKEKNCGNCLNSLVTALCIGEE